MRIAKRRGRPRLNDNRDVVIAKTVERLLWWGFAGEREVFETVGLAAKNILGRGDSYRLPLGPDRVKQIYRKHAIRQGRSRYTKESLYWRCPDKNASVDFLAHELLNNDGDWPNKVQNARHWSPVYRAWMESVGVIPEDLVLTPKAQKGLRDYPRMVISRVSWGPSEGEDKSEK